MMKAAAKNIFLFTASFAIVLILLDIYMKYAAIAQVTIYSYNPVLGRQFIPGSEYTMLTEGLATGNINQYGYIGPAYGKDRKKGTLRVALLGDSYIEGFQHLDRNHLRAVLENELKQKYSINAEVLNFGRFGYNLLDMYSLYNNYVKEFKPDITLFFVSNPDLVEAPEREGLPYPYVENDSLKIVYSMDSGSRLPWFLSMNQMGMISPAVQMIRNSLNLYRKGESMKIIFGKFYQPFYTEKREEENTAETDAPAQVHKKILQELSRSHSNIIIHRDKYDMNPHMANTIYNSGIMFIPLNDTLRAIEGGTFNPYLWKYSGKEGHWNHKAHEVVGKYLALKLNSLYKK